MISYEPLEGIQNGGRVKARLLIGRTEEYWPCVLLGVEKSGNLELEALCDLVDEQLRPTGLRSALAVFHQAVGLVEVLALKATKDRLPSTLKATFEGGRCFILNSERGAVEEWSSFSRRGVAEVLIHVHRLHQRISAR